MKRTISLAALLVLASAFTALAQKTATPAPVPAKTATPAAVPAKEAVKEAAKPEAKQEAKTAPAATPSATPSSTPSAAPVKEAAKEGKVEAKSEAKSGAKAEAKTDDASVAAAVKEKIGSMPSLKDAKIDVSVSGGVATLTGMVKNGGLKGVATNAAKRVAGVKSVSNKIEIEKKK